MANTCYKELGIDIYIEWNNRKLLSGLVSICNIDDDLISRVILSVDKLAKIGEDGVIDELSSYNIEKSSLEQLFSYFKLNINELEKMFKDSENQMLKEGISEVLELQSYIDKLGLDICRFTPYLARGLEIYTGTIWEVFDKEGRITSSIGAGGRYDKIITNFINDGNEYPAVGMTFGLVPIYEILVQSANINSDSLYDLYLIPMDTNVEVLSLANILRENGIRVLIEMNNRKIKKCFEWANKNNIPYVSVLGENEIKDHKIFVKNMFKQETSEFDINDIEGIVKYLKG